MASTRIRVTPCRSIKVTFFPLALIPLIALPNDIEVRARSDGLLSFAYSWNRDLYRSKVLRHIICGTLNRHIE